MAKVLLIEDDPLMVRMYQRKLVNDGYEAMVAVDGEEGLVKVRSFRPDLVLLDIMMPKLNGLQVLERLKADPTTAKTPVVILTNLGGTQDDIERGLELGAVAYLVKSAYRPDEVIAKVKEVLEGYTRSKEIPKVAIDVSGGATRVLESTSQDAIRSDSIKDQSVGPSVKEQVKSPVKEEIKGSPPQKKTQPKSAELEKKEPLAFAKQLPTEGIKEKRKLPMDPPLTKKEKSSAVVPVISSVKDRKEDLSRKEEKNAEKDASAADTNEMIW